jgi:hypothetical protein
MKKKSYVIMMLIPALLAGCQSSSSSPESSSSVDYSSVNDLRGAFKALGVSHSYVMKTESVLATSKTATAWQNVYTENYAMSLLKGADWGYAVGSKGLYQLSLVDGAVRAGEYLKKDDGSSYSSLWDSGLFSTFAAVDYTVFAEGATSAEITDKKTRLALMDGIGLAAANYANLTSVTASMSGDVSSLSIVLALTKVTFTVTFASFGTAKNDLIDDCLKTAAPYEASADISFIRDAFMDNNYEHAIVDSNDVVVGYEHFCPLYFYNDYSSSGLMSLDHKKYNNVEYTGSYSFNISGTTVSLFTSHVYNESPDLVNVVYNYPSNLLLWSRLEALDKDTTKTGVYKTDDARIVADFVSNYQLSSSLSSAGATASALQMTLSDVGSSSAVCLFTLYCYVGTALNYMEIKMLKFGSSNLKVVDDFMANQLK